VRLDGALIHEASFAKGEYRRHTVIRVSDDLYAPGKELSVKAVNEQGASEPLSCILATQGTET